jgi:hypothetical protein
VHRLRLNDHVPRPAWASRSAAPSPQPLDRLAPWKQSELWDIDAKLLEHKHHQNSEYKHQSAS